MNLSIEWQCEQLACAKALPRCTLGAASDDVMFAVTLKTAATDNRIVSLVRRRFRNLNSPRESAVGSVMDRELILVSTTSVSCPVGLGLCAAGMNVAFRDDASTGMVQSSSDTPLPLARATNRQKV